MVGIGHDTHCPLCGSVQVVTGLTWRSIPVHTVVLHYSIEEARAQPCGDMVLSCCKDCGFVFNAAYEPALQHYRHDYEATQSFSGTFNAFNTAIAEEVARVCGLRAGVAVEVGCGQGEFLALLRRHGVSQLVGFDPAFDPRRSAVTGDEEVIIHAGEFTPDAVDQPAAAIVCKMTLEHIARPVEFLSELARLASMSEACSVFIQVPNADLVFRTGAFWDIYYEHCCYFTPHTLGLAMERAGLRVDEMRTGFDQQYLIVRASLGSTHTEHGRAPRSTVDLFDAFCGKVRHEAEQWSNRVRHMRDSGSRIALWGGGSKAVAFLTATGIADHIAAVIDINPRKAGTFLAASSVEVIGPDEIARFGITDILIMNPAYRDEVAALLSDRGLEISLRSVN